MRIEGFMFPEDVRKFLRKQFPASMTQGLKKIELYDTYLYDAKDPNFKAEGWCRDKEQTIILLRPHDYEFVLSHEIGHWVYRKKLGHYRRRKWEQLAPVGVTKKEIKEEGEGFVEEEFCKWFSGYPLRHRMRPVNPRKNKAKIDFIAEVFAYCAAKA